MSISDTHSRWITKLTEQISVFDGVEYEDQGDGHIILSILYNGAQRSVKITSTAGDIRAQKEQFGEIRNALTSLGIIEGQKFMPPKRSRQPMSPQMAAARAKQQNEFEAWQEVWRTIRKAETSLDREYEISNMLDYY